MTDKPKIRKWYPQSFSGELEERAFQLSEFEFGGRKIGRHYLHWVYEQNPDGEGMLELALSSEGEAIGKIIATPLQFVDAQDNVIPSTLLVGAITIDSFQRMGIFKTLGERLLSQCADRGSAFTVGVTNYKARHGWVNSLGLSEHKIPIYLFPVKKGLLFLRMMQQNSLVNLFKVISSDAKLLDSRLEGLNIARIGWFDGSFGKIWDNRRRSSGLEVLRAPAHLNWRYIKAPHNRYECQACYSRDRLIGYFVLCVEERKLRWDLTTARVGFIADWQFIDNISDEEIRSMLEYQIAHLSGLGVDYIVSLAYPTSPIKPYLVERGFFPYPTNKLLWVPDVAVIKVHDKKYRHLDKFYPTDWNLMFGNNDVP
jgi:GNAT superfamily N-acetyltransferase